MKEAGRHHADSEQADEHGAPSARCLASHATTYPKCAKNRQQAAACEVCILYPAKRTQAQEADRELSNIELWAQQNLDKRNPEKHRSYGQARDSGARRSKEAQVGRAPLFGWPPRTSQPCPGRLLRTRRVFCWALQFCSPKDCERIGVDSKVNAKITSFSAKKRMGIVKAAHDLFLDQGYELTSMDDIAARARVSKPTVYSHFRDKEALFAEVVRATTDDVGDLVSLVSRSLADPEDFELKLLELARKFLTALMQPQMLKLRRMVIANAERFPEVGRLWYEQGFERVLRTLADCFQRLADRTVLKLDDPDDCSPTFCGAFALDPSQQDHVHA